MDIHETSTFNVEATLTQWYIDRLGEVQLPVWLPNPTIVVDWQDIPSSLPCWSISHIPVGFSPRYQGDVEDNGTSVIRASAILEINAWVSRDQKYMGGDIWKARLTFMVSAVQTIWNHNKAIPLQDFSAPGNPLPTNYLVRLNNMNVVQTARDTNPAIERRRMLINYNWHMRTSI